ncbi:hypothetical protein A2U01_0046843, partial [Trifolium medium]|nr:hypothetical protein [Trifolium medium]
MSRETIYSCVNERDGGNVQVPIKVCQCSSAPSKIVNHLKVPKVLLKGDVDIPLALVGE